MKISPIIFSSPMVAAILEGRKTVTRRIVKPRTPEDFALMINMEAGIKVQKQIDELIMTSCPYGEPGDILWVRESFYKSVAPDGIDYPAYYFKVSHNGKRISTDENIKWKPSIHMPKAASRIFLKITGVRVERLQEISGEDILNEGIRYPIVERDGMAAPLFKVGEHHSAQSFLPKDWAKLPNDEINQKLLFAHWAELWVKINGIDSWNLNPWVWVISFECTGKPEKF